MNYKVTEKNNDIFFNYSPNKKYKNLLIKKLKESPFGIKESKFKLKKCFLIKKKKIILILI